jgi:DNA-binding IclR family transcriptional regulator
MLSQKSTVYARVVHVRDAKRYNQGRPVKTPSVPALERALAILELLSGSRAGLTLPEIAKELGLPKSSVHCLLLTLERHGYLNRNERTSRYMFGSKLFAIGNRSLNGLRVRQVAAPHMHTLMERVGLTVHLAVLEQYEAVLVEKVEPPGIYKLATWLGKRMDVHCTALGKALIGRLPEEELASLVREKGLARHNDNSIASLKKLQQELARSQAAGYYIDDEEDEIGHRCIGASIIDEIGQVVAAISISGTILQVREDNSKDLATAVQEAAAAISTSLVAHEPHRPRELDTPAEPVFQ